MTNRKDIAWDKKNFVPNFVISTATQLFASFLSFLISYLILKKYSDSVLGQLALLISYTQVFVFLSNWSLVSVQKMATDEFLERGNIRVVFSNRLLLLLLNYLAVALLFLTLHRSFSISFNTALLALLYGFVLALNTHFYAGFQARKLLRMQGLMLLTEKILLLGGLFLLVNASNISVNRILAIYLGASLTVSCICLHLSRHQIVFNTDTAVLKKISLFALPLIPYTAVAFLSTNYCDNFFINKYLLPADIGLYTIAYQFNGIWLQIPAILGGIILPLFITSNKQYSDSNTLGYVKTYGITMNNLWTAASFLAIIFLVLVLPLFYKGFTPDFFTSLYLFLAGSSFSFSSGVFFSPFLLSKGNLKITLPLAILSAAANIIGNIVLIPLLGIAGSALSSVIFAFLFSTTLMIYISHKYKADLSKFLINNGIIMGAVLLSFLLPDILMLCGIFLSIYIFLLILYRDKTVQMFKIMLSGLKGNEVRNVV